MSFVLSKYSFKSNALLDKIKSEFMQELDKIRSTKMYPKGEILYEEGSNPKAVYRLKSGKVKIEQLSLDGKIRIVYVYTQGEFFGFRPLLSNEKHPVSAIFLEDSEVEIYEGKEFIEISKKAPNLSFNLVEILSFEFNVWINLISSLSHKSAKEKIALILLILNEKYRNVNGKSQLISPEAFLFPYALIINRTKHKINLFVRFFCFIFFVFVQ